MSEIKKKTEIEMQYYYKFKLFWLINFTCIISIIIID
jgi:hypothetical protein